jgi:hypothetical protein
MPAGGAGVSAAIMTGISIGAKMGAVAGIFAASPNVHQTIGSQPLDQEDIEHDDICRDD